MIEEMKFKMDSAFENRMVTYRSQTSENHQDYEEFFEKLKGKLDKLIFISQSHRIEKPVSCNIRNKILAFTKSFKIFYEELNQN